MELQTKKKSISFDSSAKKKKKKKNKQKTKKNRKVGGGVRCNIASYEQNMNDLLQNFRTKKF
jgi:CelD/BcsL family acetyltransferase involved in cellulose biosynthesis